MSHVGLKRKQGKMDVKDSKKLISGVEDKISKTEEVKKLFLVFMFKKFTILIFFSKNMQFLFII